jgi:hypothetical protein
LYETRLQFDNPSYPRAILTKVFASRLLPLRYRSSFVLFRRVRLGVGPDALKDFIAFKGMG